MKNVIVIGGGPAGMMAAICAARQGSRVILTEKNEKLGKKLFITGKGRCNVTNNCEIRDVLANIPGDGRFLYSSLNAFPPSKVIEFFESRGLPLKTERGSRVFPESDNANDVADLLESACRRAGVRVVHERALEILTDAGRATGAKTKSGTVRADSVVICTGGLSYPLTGSTGDGYRFAAKAGLSVTELQPSLVPLECREEYCRELQGLSLRNVTLSVFEDGKLIFRELGEMLFTHFGVSGPLVLTASSRMRNFKSSAYTLEIDLKPALDEKKLDVRLLRDFEKYSNKEFKNSLSDLVPSSLAPVIVRLSEIDGELKTNSVTRTQRKELLKLLKAFPLSVTDKRPAAEAIVTSGGVSIKEIDPRTMESKKVPGLYFAGEVLDLDAYTGGFNLQIAWSTGHAAGKAVKGAENEIQ